jgi:hypothetical protein
MFPELCHDNVIFTAEVTITGVYLVFLYTYGENHYNMMGL